MKRAQMENLPFYPFLNVEFRIMKKFYMAFVAAASLALSACGVIPHNTAMFSAIAIDAGSPGIYYANPGVRPLKKGVAEQKGIILFTDGDASIKAAMDNGKITKIHHIDFKTTTIFFLYTKQTTIVYGE